jgi:hypothetical protein
MTAPLQVNREALARRFSCQTPERMEWSAVDNIRQCLGCSGRCGMSFHPGDWAASLFETPPAPQLELFQ